MAEGGWLKMPPKKKFRELKSADEEKALLEKSVPKSTESGLLIFLHSGKMQGWTNKQRTKKQGSTWNGTKYKV